MSNHEMWRVCPKCGGSYDYRTFQKKDICEECFYQKETPPASYEWRYRYVPEGQLEFDEHGRWAIDCYMFVHIDKALPQYKWLKGAYPNDYMPVRVATMFQKGSRVGHVPSLIDRFCVPCPSFIDAANLGFSHKRNFFSNDIEELKRIVEEQLELIRTVFKHSL